MSILKLKGYVARSTVAVTVAVGDMTQSYRLHYCDIKEDKLTYVLLLDLGVYTMSSLFTMTS